MTARTRPSTVTPEVTSEPPAAAAPPSSPRAPRRRKPAAAKQAAAQSGHPKSAVYREMLRLREEAE